MLRKIVFLIIGSALFAIIGLFVGINIGGNIDTSFEFMGGSGYEATGYLGALLGAILGIMLGILIDRRLSLKNEL